MPPTSATRPRNLVVDLVDDLAALRPAWDALASASRNVFLTWEWFEAWWAHFGEGHELRVATCTAPDGRVVAILPLYLARRRPRLFRLVGNSVSGALGVVCAPEDLPESTDALLASLPDLGCDVLLADGVVDGASLRGRTLLRVPCPVITLAFSSWDEYLASCSANFRQQLRRKERKLAGEHELQYRLVGEPATVADDMRTLFELHEQRWSGDESLFTTAARTAFHQDFARVAADRGWLRFWFLELEGVPVAAWYGFRFGGIETYYQLGRDQAWEAASVGMLVVAHSLRAAIEDGMREYHLGPGGSSYKFRFTDDDSAIDTVAVAATPTGRVAVAAGALLVRSRTLKTLSRRVLSLDPRARRSGTSS